MNFVITGVKGGLSKVSDYKNNLTNLIYTGYLSDAGIKALMCKCKAFLHPAIYEGFGIPPLEALSCGAKLIISDRTCLPEIYGDSAIYIDPYNYDINLDDLLKTPTAAPDETLSKYDWDKEAKKLYKILCDLK